LINQTLANTTNNALTANYTVTPYANGCPGTAVTFLRGGICLSCFT
jgi:hypothetical protein